CHICFVPSLPTPVLFYSFTPPRPHPTPPPLHPLLPHRSRSRSTLTRCSIFCLFEMGREKRKGKEVLVEKPVCKRTRAEREAERAEMVAKAAEEQASGRARPFAIRDPPARGRGRGRGMGRVRGARATRATTQQTEGDTSEGEPTAAESDHSVSDADSDAAQSEQTQGQGTQESPTLRRSGRTRQTSPAGESSPATERRTGPRTRGGHQAQEPRRSAAAAAARRAEALEAERAVFRMDTVVRLEPGVLLQKLTRANAAKVKRLRWSIEEEDWFPVTCDSRSTVGS